MNVTGSGMKWLGEGDADSEKIHLLLLCKAAASLVCPRRAGVSFLCLLPPPSFVTWWGTGMGVFAWDEGGEMVKKPPK